MAELGIIAAAFELLEVGRTGLRVCESIWKAPEQIQDAITRCSRLCDRAALFAEYVRRTQAILPLSSEEIRILQDHKEDAQIAIAAIKDAFADQLRAPSFLKQIRWAAIGQQKINLLLKKMTEIEASISYVLQLISLESLQSSASSAAERQRLIRYPQLEQISDQQILESQQNIERGLNPALSSLGRMNLSAAPNRRQLNTANSLENELRTVQAYANSISYGSRALAEPVGYLGLTLANGLNGMSMSNASNNSRQVRSRIVSHDSTVMSASRAGNAALLLKLIARDSGIQHSRTIGNLTPLCFVTESGNTTAAQALLSHGVHIDSSFGERNTTALCAALSFHHLQMARFLINSGASYTHRTIWGWSPLFHLWMREEIHPPAPELLTLLWSRPDFALLHQDVYDVYGWSPMHRAAAYGAAEDMRMLISYGLDPLQRMKFVRKKKRKKSSKNNNRHSFHSHWSVLRIAVYYGRLDICKVLLPYYLPIYGVDIPNRRGWTLLHLAVERGHLEIAKLLIKHGADVFAKTTPTLSGVSSDTTGQLYTPLSLAQEVGPEYYQEVHKLIKSRPVTS